MDIWQPIETAPKDGSSILLYQREQLVNFYGVGKWEDTTSEVLEEVERKGKRVISEWVTHESGFWDTDAVYSPTHWMPLPPPPPQQEG